MKPFLGPFVHWDVVTRQEPPKFLGKFFKEEKDSEYHISKKLHSRIASSLVNLERRIAGNAGNAAVSISELGIASVLSCPNRAKPLMSGLAKHKIFLMSGGKESPPLKCSRLDDDPEHVVFEMKRYRKIFNYDEIQRNFILDYDFWNSIKNSNYLFLCGFHNVPERHKKKANEIADFLENRKFKVHLELGFGKNSLMKYAEKTLIERNCVDSLGMSDTDITAFETKGLGLKEKAHTMIAFLEKTSLERISLHSREYRLTVFKKEPERNLKAAEFSIQACAAKALGGIKENMGKAKSVPISAAKAEKGKDFFIIPTRVVESSKIIVGLGDTAAVTDSLYALKK